MASSRWLEAFRALASRRPEVLQRADVDHLFKEHPNKLTEEHCRALAQRLLVQPGVTLAAASCFRPFLSDIVQDLVSQLQSQSPRDSATTPFVPYHEQVAVAFSFLLPLAPQLLDPIQHYFSTSPEPFARLLAGIAGADGPSQEWGITLHAVAQASHRLLSTAPAIFRELWNWGPFFDLLAYQEPSSDSRANQDTPPQGGASGDSDGGGGTGQAAGNGQPIPTTAAEIRWSAVQVARIVLQLSDASTEQLAANTARLTPVEAAACAVRWEDEAATIDFERARMFMTPSKAEVARDLPSAESSYSEASAPDPSVSPPSPYSVSGQAPLGRLQVCGIDLPLRQYGGQGSGLGPGPPLIEARSALVLTPTTRRNLEAVSLGLCQGRPVLLEGPPGAGKSAIIDEVARVTGNHNVIKFHLDDQTDSKTLLGSYVCTEVPGEFRWQAGALTQAVAKGIWVVFEDVDCAPFEVLSALILLLEDRQLYIPGRGEVLPAAPNFQVFGTVTTRTGRAASAGTREVLGSHWARVSIAPPEESELVDIASAAVPEVAPLVPKMAATLQRVRVLTGQSAGGNAGGAVVQVGRLYTARDLLKWARRVAASVRGMEHLLVSGADRPLPQKVREVVYAEAVDCLAGAIPKPDDRRRVLQALASDWGVLDSQVEYYSQLHKPGLQIGAGGVQVGRATLPAVGKVEHSESRGVYAQTGHTMRLLERVGVCVQQNEPALLVGETGTGKTALVQFLARQVGATLTVLNMSQQTDSADFLGGFKPVEAHAICVPLATSFFSLFRRTFPSQQNNDFVARVRTLAEKRKWVPLLKACRSAVERVAKLADASTDGTPALSPQASGDEPQPKQITSKKNGHPLSNGGPQGSPKGAKRRRPMDPSLMEQWRTFAGELARAERQVEAAQTAFAFAFIEGALVKALREGHWLLLDEINLAPADALERLSGVLDGERGSLCLTEKGDVETIPRHPSFRIFGAMNPATDVGKRDLPLPLRQRFTELYVDELTGRDDLRLLVARYLGEAVPGAPVDDIVDFYLAARQEAEATLLDGANQRPGYSLRTLSRALEYTVAALPIYGFQRALFDGFCMGFLTLLDRPSAPTMERLLVKHLLKGSVGGLKALLRPPPQPSPNHVLFEHFWVEAGTTARILSEADFAEGPGRSRYVMTESVREHLKNLARAVLVRRYPILLQGPTSSGKTSLVEHLAARTGHRFVRINNHEHTDLQEYLGSYATDPQSGRLVFQEGALVEAVRKGHWIVLDELNLAPSDVLEALNRLLDDNRELFVPELQVTIKPHPHFMLFATQNPPGTYGGRKALSRAFRSRFLELHVDDIPASELTRILELRCGIPASYAAKMVDVLKDLQRHRQGTAAFAGKHGFVTPRDLFRWAERHATGYEELARDGFLLLGERLRDEAEKQIVKATLEKHMRVKLDLSTLHEVSSSEAFQALEQRMRAPDAVAAVGKIVWTGAMRRLFHLVERCLAHNEPALLVGETGAGKTSVCQMLALLRGQRLHILNCHQHTETSDFLGGFRPVRDRERTAARATALSTEVAQHPLFQATVLELDPAAQSPFISTDVQDAAVTISLINRVVHTLHARTQSPSESLAEGIECLTSAAAELQQLVGEWQALFAWHDGPLVAAMRNGDMLLVDEISLAEDSVLERLNSVLEPKRLLVLAEKGGTTVEELVAHPNFRLLATMNPGGDFGKKELSPALRNRFTELWVPAITNLDDLRSIVQDRLPQGELRPLAEPLLRFWQWFQHEQQGGGKVLSVRDLLAWVSYIVTAAPTIGPFPAFMHGAFLVLLDGIGLGLGISAEAAARTRTECYHYLLDLLPEVERAAVVASSGIPAPGIPLPPSLSDFGRITADESSFGLHPFYIPRGPHAIAGAPFELGAPRTCRNAMRVMRGLQLRKPVLLEGSPGVGKTSLVAALAAASGHKLVRINLSEQTDMMDLLGTDLPTEGAAGGTFTWSDGVFLQALRGGDWVLLDELNLASQSILEGLNSVLDHRAEVFIPELGRTFRCPPTFRLFAAQNPLQQGGGRKGLPKSFLNRFSRVYVEALEAADLEFICTALFLSISSPTLHHMVSFNERLHHETMVAHSFGHRGAPWEFNLRDILRWCELILKSREEDPLLHVAASDDEAAGQHLGTIYLQRMRQPEDRRRVVALYREVFGTEPSLELHPRLTMTPETLQLGRTTLSRERDPGPGQAGGTRQLAVMPGQLSALETVARCVQRGWMSILLGGPASGKTSLVRTLAQLTGNVLHEYPLTSASDTTELLGCFEQFDPMRRMRSAHSRAQSALQSVCELLLSRKPGSQPAARLIEMVKSLQASWTAYAKRAKAASLAEAGAGQIDTSEGALDLKALELLQHLVAQLSSALTAAATDQIPDEASDDVSTLQTRLSVLTVDVSGLVQEAGASGGAGKVVGRFEWVDGVLVHALERGEWVLLENANLCNPTVLDRLNPLLEPGGTVMVNERGLVEGQPMVVTAHPKFRLFLTLDPGYGELSRAMRNRGIEVFMMPPDWASDQGENETEPERSTLWQDMLRTLAVAGIPGRALSEAMARAHVRTAEAAAAYSSGSGALLTLRDLARFAELVNELLERGAEVRAAIRVSWDHTHVAKLDSMEARAAAEGAYEQWLANVHLAEEAPGSDQEAGSSGAAQAMKAVEEEYLKAALVHPARWPNVLTSAKWAQQSQLAAVKRDGEYLLFLAAQSVAGEVATILSRSKGTAFGEHLRPWLEKEAHESGELLAALVADIWREGGKGDARSRAERMLWFASACLVQRVSPLDADLRGFWVQAVRGGFLGLRTSGITGDLLGGLAELMEQLEGHPVTAQLGRVRLALARLVGASVATLERQPYDLRVLNLAAPAGTPTEAHLLLVAALADSWGLARTSIQQQVVMDRFLEQGRSEGAASLVGQSFRYYKAPSQRARTQVAHRVVPWLYPLFEAVQNWEDALLRSLAAEGFGGLASSGDNMEVDEGPATAETVERMVAEVRELNEALRVVQQWRYSLWTWVAQRQQLHPPEAFLVRWEGLSRALLGLGLARLAARAGQEQRTKVETAAKLLDEALTGGEGSLGKPLLWKYGGRPQAPGSLELCLEEAAVLGLCDELKVRGGNGSEGVAVGGEVRRLAVQGLCMLQWAKGLDRGPGAKFESAGVEGVHAFLQRQVQAGQEKLSEHTDFDPIPHTMDEAGGWVVSPSQLWKSRSVQGGEFPHELLRWEGARALSQPLLALYEVASLSSQAALIPPLVEWAVSTGTGSPAWGPPEHSRLQSLLDTWLAVGPRSPADFAPAQQLFWLLDAVAAGGVQDLGLAIRAAVHEFVYRWHAALWDNVSSALPAAFHTKQGRDTPAVNALLDAGSSPLLLASTGSSPRGHSEFWTRTAGPARLYQAPQTVLSAALVHQSSPIGDHLPRLLQLQLAARHLWAAAAHSEAATPADSGRADVRAAAVVLFQIVLAHSKAFPPQALEALVGGLETLRGALHGSGTTDLPQTVAGVVSALGQSQHPRFAATVPSLVEPALNTLSELISGDVRSLVQRGRLWLFIGALRLHLLLPSNGCDPAAKYAHQRDHFQEVLADRRLEVEVRETVERLATGGPANDADVARLRTEASDLVRKVEQLAAKVVHRPEPPQFGALFEEVTRFVGSSARVERVVGLANGARAGQAGAGELEVWQGNLGHLVQRLTKEYPAYRDVAQPVQLAAYELRYGAALMAAAGVEQARFGGIPGALMPVGRSAELEELLGWLMGFPVRRSGGLTEGGDGSESGVWQKWVDERALQLLSSTVVRNSGDAPAIELQMKVLQLVAARAAQAATAAGGASRESLEVLGRAFGALVRLWSGVKERRAEKEREDAELYKYKVRSHVMRTEEEENEADYKEMFPDYFEQYADIEGEPEMASAEDDDRRAAAAEAAAAQGVESDASQKASWNLLQEMVGPVVRLHGQVFGPVVEIRTPEVPAKSKTGKKGKAKQTEAALPESDRDTSLLNAFVASYDTGVQLLHHGLGLVAGPEVEQRTLSGHVLRVSLEHRRLSRRPNADAAAININVENPPELALALHPLARVLQRLGDLLREWPDHPVLQQLQKICERVVALPADAPLVKALVGLELLLTKAQIWQEGAARHVSLAAELDEVARLVARWRKAELASWPSLMEQVRRKHEKAAEALWFALYGLVHRPGAASTAPDATTPAPNPTDRDAKPAPSALSTTIAGVEEFIQTSTLGEYHRRLQMVAAFGGEMSVRARGADNAEMAALSSALKTVHSYYCQFVPTVADALRAGGDLVEKELREFVRLQKWEDRNVYAMQASAERSHRKLHKLASKLDEVLKQPVAQLLARQSDKVGFSELAKLGGSAPESLPAGKEPVDAASKAGEAAAGVSATDEEDAIEAGAEGPGVQQQWSEFCSARLAALTEGHEGEVVEKGPRPLYQHRLPSLAARLSQLLGSTVLSEQGARRRKGGADAVERLSGVIVRRAQALKASEAKRSVKKKALVDLLKGLRGLGLSHHKSAVPVEERDPKNWFLLARPDHAERLYTVANLDAETEDFVVASSVAGAASWGRAEGYYHRNMAQLQQLWQARQDFSKDLSLREVDIACRFVEHLLHVQRTNRSTADRAAALLSQLGALSTLLASLHSRTTQGDGAPLPPQASTRRQLSQQKALLEALLSSLTEVESLIATGLEAGAAPAADEVETGPAANAPTAHDAQTALETIRDAKAVLQRSRVELHAFLTPKGVLEETSGDWPLLVTPAMQAGLTSSAHAVRDIVGKITAVMGPRGEKEAGPVGRPPLPGWQALSPLLRQGLELADAVASTAAGSAPDSGGGDQKRGGERMAAFSELFEKVVADALVAAQNVSQAAKAESEPEEQLGTEEGDAVEEDEEAAEEEWASEETLQTWEERFASQLDSSRLERLAASTRELVSLASDVAEAPAGRDDFVRVQAMLARLQPLLEMLRAAGLRVLADQAAFSKSVAKLGYVLANLFAGLFREGFCGAKEESGAEGATNFEDAEGMGMGAGEGQKDVSDQIENEDQLLGNKGDEEEGEKTGEKKKGDEKVKGVEMEEDFEGEMLDLSEDEEQEGDEEEEGDEKEERLDEKMGEAGEDDDIVDEKLWGDDDKEDEQGKQEQEKYEKDAPMSGAEQEDLEYRGKEEEGEEGKDEEQNRGKKEQKKEEKEAEKEGGEEGGEEERGEDEGEINVDSEDKYEESHGLKAEKEEELELPEDMNLDGGEEKEEEEGGGDGEETAPEVEGTEQDGGKEKKEGDAEEEAGGDGEEAPGVEEPASDEGEGEENEEGEKKAEEEGQEARAEEDGGEGEGAKEEEELRMQQLQHEEELETGPVAMQEQVESAWQGAPQERKAEQSVGVKGGTDGQEMTGGDEEAEENAGGGASEQRQTGGAQQMDKGERNVRQEESGGGEKKKRQERLEANPYRSAGDALRQWKERVRMVGDQTKEGGEEQPEGQGEEEGGDQEEGAGKEEGDMDAEYEYVANKEEATAQALGAATDDQAAAEKRDADQNGDDMDEDAEEARAPELDEPEPEPEATEPPAASAAKSRKADRKKALDSRPLDENAELAEGSEDEEGIDWLPEDQSEEAFDESRMARAFEQQATLKSLVGEEEDAERSLEMQPLTEEELRQMRDDLERKLREAQEMGGPEGAAKAAALWRRYEVLTSRLSQELTEQLRLILEPTLASKLQGDYRSGKRINMKKVIPYIASQFRKDKIWLRRTKPNKRQYQVVIAIDDSRSMGESRCGHLALEASVALCRAMTQLEVGEMAVVSFGARGNTRLVHPFERPFTDEAGAAVLSQFSFRQDNTIADEPVVDLLRFLGGVLESARARVARSAAGGANQLQQLVLIIADGRFHEKESLKRCIREAQRAHQLLAFLILDNPQPGRQESILDMQTVSFAGGAPSFSKYLDTFPFPYYILLRDAAALPRTLGDLLRQWYEMSQRLEAN